MPTEKRALSATILGLALSMAFGCGDQILVPVTAPLPDAGGSDTGGSSGPPVVDILWVIDSSRSMGEEQAELGARFDAFASALVAMDADFRIAVVTTDVDRPETRGRFVTEPGVTFEEGCRGIPDRLQYCDGRQDDRPYLHSATYRATDADGTTVFDSESLTRDFRCIASVGDCGPGIERGLDAVDFALSPNMLETANGDFLRDDAHLVVIFLTDEDDCSNTSGVPITRDADCYAEERRDQLVPVQLYYDMLVAAKGGAPERVSIAGLIGPDDGQGAQTYAELAEDGPRFSCVSELGGDGDSAANARDGERYRELIELAGDRGVEASICDGFSDSLVRIADLLRPNP